MKKITLGLLAVLVLVVAAVVTLPFVIDVNRFKEPLLKKVETQINGKVQLGNIRLKFFPFIGLRLEDLAVRNLPETAFKEEPIVKLGVMDLRVHLKSILERKIVATLELQSPEARLIKVPEGTNLDLLIKKPAEVAPPPVETPAAPTTPETPKKSLITDIVVEKFSIANGLLAYDDRTAGKPLKISGLRLDVANAVLTDTSKPIGIDLGLRLFDAKDENVAFKGNVSVDQKAKVAKLEKGQLTLAGSTISLDLTVEDYERQKKIDLTIAAPAFALNSAWSLLPEAKRSLPPGSSLEGGIGLNLAAHGTPESVALKGAVDLTSCRIQYGETPVKEAGSSFNLSMEGTYTPQAMTGRGAISAEKLRYAQYTISNLKGAIAYSGKTVQLDELGFDLFEGRFTGSGVIDLGGEKPSWDMHFHVNNANIDTALAQVASLPNILTGRGTVDLKVKGTGTTADDVKKSVTGDGQLSLKDGELKAFSLAPNIFGEKLIGGMTSEAAKNPQAKILGLNFSPPGVVETLKSTPYEQLLSSIIIEAGKVLIPDFGLNHAGSRVELGGGIGLDQKVDLKGRYYLGRSETDAWITDPKIRSYLVDGEGRFVVPFVITGDIKMPFIAPDVTYVQELVGKALVGLVKEEAKKQVTEQIQKVAPQIEEKAKEEIKKAIPDIGKELKKLF